MRAALLSALILLMVSGCKSGKIDTKHPEKNSKLLVAMERTACFGKCPIYQVKIYDNGLLIYNGEKFTDKTGCWYTKISAADLKSLKAMFSINGFVEMEAQYPPDKKYPTDLPSCILTYYYSETEVKKVVDHGWQAPAALKQLQERVDSFLSAEKLRPCDK